VSKIRTVLFDLDGTLIDTAPDMAAALDKLCAEQNQTALPYAEVRPHVSNGSAALVKLAFGENLDSAYLEILKQRYLELYAQDLAQESKLFAGTEAVLQHLESNNLNWGVVTNKPGFLTLPLMQALKLDQRAACIVSGDSTQNRKPHPEPMHFACELAGSKSEQCIYVGDARRDIEAGYNAGMKTLVARYGYIGEWENIADWGADAQIDKPEDILLHI
jgi:2-phosphoglycolate phosphatase